MKHPPKNIVVDWLNTIWETNLPYQAKYLACYLRKFMNSQHDMAYPSYARMIHETGLSRSSISRYMEVLESEGWVIRDRGSKGKNTTYTACFPTSVTEKLVSERNQVVSERHTTSVRETHELNKEVNNKVNNIEIPENINSEAWQEWIEYRKSKKKPVSKIAANKQFKLLGNYDFYNQQLIINQSIQNDYQGLFELKGNSYEKNNRPNQTGRPTNIDRVNQATDEWLRQRTAQTGDNGEAMENTSGNLREFSGDVRGCSDRSMGTTIEGDYTTTDQQRIKRPK